MGVAADTLAWRWLLRDLEADRASEWAYRIAIERRWWHLAWCIVLAPLCWIVIAISGPPEVVE